MQLALRAVLIVLVGVLLVRIYLLVNRGRTLRAISRWNMAHSPPLGRPWPAVSVLVAARDEEANIGACVESLLRQEFPVREIIVVDDASTDRTPEILAEYQRRAAHLRVLRIDQLPHGWVGKTHAMWRGAQEATGEYLLFLDADVTLSPDCLAQVVRYAVTTASDLTTMVPAMRCETFWEKVVLPLGAQTVYLGIRRALGPDRRHATAFGCFLLFARTTYDAIGGHRRLRDALVDDTAFGRLVKQGGYRLSILGGRRDHLTVRWYADLSAMWQGFARKATGSSGALPAAAGCMAVPILFALPWFAVPASLAYQAIAGFDGAATAACLVAAATCMLWLLASRTIGMPRTYPHLEWLGALMVTAMLAGGVVRALAGRGIAWSGRTYPGAPPAVP
jgi:chlorobactene glucosyltransferase